MDAHLAFDATRMALQRRMLGITQAELSKKSGLTISSLSRWESEVSTPKPMNIPSLAAALGLEPRDLLRLVDVPLLSTRRALAAMTSQDTAEASNMSRFLYMRMEAGDAAPLDDELHALARTWTTPVVLVAMSAEYTLADAAGETISLQVPPAPTGIHSTFHEVLNLVNLPWQPLVTAETLASITGIDRDKIDELRADPATNLTASLSIARHYHLPDAIACNPQGYEAQAVFTSLRQARKLLGRPASFLLRQRRYRR